MSGKDGRVPKTHAWMPQTRWTLVQGAQDPTLQKYKDAWEDLIQAYWDPVRVYLKGTLRLGEEDAEDLTQSFFARLIERNGLRAVDRQRGRFRAFLKTAAKNFALNQMTMRHAAKRGGRVRIVEGEVPETADEGFDPDRTFDQEWKDALLRRTLNLLERELKQEGRESDFQAFYRYYLEESSGSYEELAREFGCSVAEIRNRLRLARGRFRSIGARVAQEAGVPADDISLGDD